ncbi:MAG: CpsD/CapB family tyrosine-protein kinase, partial [Acidobacteria bacterium]|nr:CpsD/CapB family tyrosine-protein kinase [Acidobacteriota bacterium]
GKTCSSINLAVTLAQAGHRTLLIDADFHRPQGHKHFGLTNERGLSDALVSEGPVEGYAQGTPVPGLFVISTGPTPPSPAELLGAGRMKERLEEAVGKFDRVVIDSPPVCAVTDACVVAPHVDGVVLVVQPGLTDRSGAKRSLELLEGVGVRPVGVVLNKIPSDGSGYYYYYYRYRYYSKDKAGKK